MALASQPRSVAEAIGGLSATVGTHDIDAQAFADGIAFFRRDQFIESRSAFARGSGLTRRTHAVLHCLLACYRQGWHRTHRDDPLYREGLKHVDQAIRLAPGSRLVVNDETLQMRSADELRAELEAGLTRDASDLNPLRLLQERK